MTSNLYSLTNLKEELAGRKEEKVVFTNGCFDLLHVGHVRYLKAAKSFGDLLVVGLNSDSSVKKLKGSKRPLIPENQRAEVIGSLAAVDYVTIFSDETAGPTISALKPEVYVKGGDYEIAELPEAKVVKSYGGEIKLVTEIKGASSTNIIERIKRRYC
jgi:D-beta-D-heptose 7-phosphate kinase/D-beta-D-heptose 1-phosphate adenosyltransferase